MVYFVVEVQREGLGLTELGQTANSAYLQPAASTKPYQSRVHSRRACATGIETLVVVQLHCEQSGDLLHCASTPRNICHALSICRPSRTAQLHVDSTALKTTPYTPVSRYRLCRARHAIPVQRYIGGLHYQRAYARRKRAKICPRSIPSPPRVETRAEQFFSHKETASVRFCLSTPCRVLCSNKAYGSSCAVEALASDFPGPELLTCPALSLITTRLATTVARYVGK